MKNASSKQNRNNRIATRRQRSLLPLVAVGGSLASLPASALELGDLTVQSRLGQPLRASIAYALAPNEQLADSCISLGAGAAASGLPGIGRATISVSDGVIRLTGKTPVREPMVAAQVAVDCPYTANLTREYMLFIDPADPAFAEQPVVQTTSATPAVTARQPSPAATPRAPAGKKVSQESIGNSTRYLVQPGDNLGEIASRIQNRSVSLWPAANAIFDANPDAFIDNNPNKLKAGSWLTIPSLDGSAPVLSMAESTGSTTAENVTANAPDTSDFGASKLELNTAADVAPVEAVETTTVEIDGAVSDTTSDLSAANAELDFYDPFVDAGGAANENIVIPDTELEGPSTTSSSPNVSTAIINTSPGESSSSWLMWLAGSGIVMIIGLLLFGRRFTGRIDAPVPDHPMRRASDDETGTTESIKSDFFDLEDDAPTEENLSLDADLIVGTGLEEATDVDMD
ncbi:MAG: type IV pilus assembly protein FimV, partial [Woeseiaceae bacterium]